MLSALILMAQATADAVQLASGWSLQDIALVGTTLVSLFGPPAAWMVAGRKERASVREQEARATSIVVQNYESTIDMLRKELDRAHESKDALRREFEEKLATQRTELMELVEGLRTRVRGLEDSERACQKEMAEVKAMIGRRASDRISQGGA